jgi:hypothetical protein
MIELIPGAPEGVYAFRVVGEITADDYVDVLNPAIEAMTTAGGVRCMCVLDDQWTGMSAGAMWEDAKLGINHLTKFERISVVTNRGWIENVTNAFAKLFPNKAKIFELDQQDEAMAWAAASD